MANTILTIDMITREAIRLWRNTNSFLRNIEMQYDDSFAKTGAKIGDTLRIRLPNDYTVRTGAAAQIQSTNEQSTTLTLATQKGVDVSFDSAQRALKLDDYSRRVLAPMVNNLAGEVATDIMSGAESGVSNLVQNTDGSGTLLTPTSETWLMAGAMLDVMSARSDMRKIITHPFTNSRTVSGLAGLFNPAGKISEQFSSGQMAANTLGADWFKDQTIISHTTGTFSAGGTVAGADQTGTTVTVNAITGTLKKGDIITFEGVNSVNRINKTDNGSLAQFVVTANVASGGTSIPIYPAIVPPQNGQKVQYQTVTASPANGAAMALVTTAGSTYRKNILYVPDAVTMATADLELPRGVHEAARETYDGLSMRMVTAYNVQTDQMITRLDILYGYLWVKPEWAVAIPDVV